MELTLIRYRTVLQLKNDYAAAIPDHLPRIEAVSVRKTAVDVGRRICVLNAVVAVSFGCNQEIALKWLTNNLLLDDVSESERIFLEKQNPPSERMEDFKLFVESAWALAWAVGAVSELNFSKYCENNFVNILPEVNRLTANAVAFIAKCKLRPAEDLLQAEDVAYVLHWLATESKLRNCEWAFPVRPYVVRLRRHALSWLFSDEEWDDVSTDT